MIRNTNLLQVKANLEQAGIHNFAVYEMDSDSKSSRPAFCIPRSKMEIICKNSQKDLVLEVISGSGEDDGIIYVNQLTPVITLNQQN